MTRSTITWLRRRPRDSILRRRTKLSFIVLWSNELRFCQVEKELVDSGIVFPLHFDP